MNKTERRKIEGFVRSLDSIKSELEEMLDNENCKFDNMPESIQESERGEAMQEAIENLESAVGSLEEAIDSLNEIVEG